MTKRIIIKNGQVTGFIDEVSFAGLDVIKQETVRVSHVIPENRVLACAFRLIRAVSNDKSRLSNWTRTWSCNWLVVIDGQRYGSFSEREAAIKFEKQKIYEQGKLHQ